MIEEAIPLNLLIPSTTKRLSAFKFALYMSRHICFRKFNHTVLKLGLTAYNIGTVHEDSQYYTDLLEDEGITAFVHLPEK